MEILMTAEDWALVIESLRFTIRHRQTTDNYLDDEVFRARQVESARETLRRVQALREQLAGI
jgi:hypothetical protein